MRNDKRKDRRLKGKDLTEGGYSLKNTLYVVGTIIALGVIAFFITVMIYNNNLNKVYKDLETQGVARANIVNKEINEVAVVNANIGKTVNEMEQEAEETTAENEEIQETIAINTSKQEEKTVTPKVEEPEEKDNKEKNEIQEPKEIKKEIEFGYPVSGEIQKEYAKDKLVYSETLKEWVTHTAIDIKAEKTTVVKAAEEGTVTAIKNDPRFGTTVIIEHQEGYETRYANLLTAEFVTVGEKVTKGQTIGTVGNTGAFEVLDECHLHFEMLKDGEYLDPTLFIK